LALYPIVQHLLEYLDNDRQYHFTFIFKLPVEIWQRDGSWTFKYASISKIDKIILDPENVLPDVNRKNNEWNDGK